MATVRDFVRKPPVPGPAHPCDAPGLSPKEFLLAVMHDTTLPLSTRIKAARDVAPYILAAPRPVAQPRCTIVIGGIPTEHQEHDNTAGISESFRRSLSPCKSRSCVKDQDGKNKKWQSKERIAEDSSRPLRRNLGPYKLRDDI
jgi:hypothetical protein